MISLADEYVREYIQAFPEYALFSGLTLPSHDRLTDNSLAAVRAWEDKEDAWLAALGKVDPDELWGRPAWVIHGFLLEALESSRALRACRREFWPVSQETGWQVTYAQIAELQPVGTADLRAQALHRWRDFARVVDVEIENLREGLRRGYSTPRGNVELVLEQLDRLLASAPTESPFYSPVQRDSDETFRKEWESVVSAVINPAVLRYRDFLRSEYLPEAREDIAVTALPNGEACYRAALRSQTTLDLEPRALHKRGVQLMETMQTDMRELGLRLFGTVDSDSLRAHLERDPRNRFKTVEEATVFSEAAVARARAALPRWFGRVPKADIIIEPYPEFRESTAGPGEYISPAEDGTRPGKYLINLYRQHPEQRRRASYEVIAFHETYPGHHLQGSIAQERAASHPLNRLLWSPGFGEGWAKYAEQLAHEMGLYSSDLDRLGAVIFGLPAGIIVDPGIHVLGWSRDQAIQYYLSNLPSTQPELAANLVDRAIVWPGQLTAYRVGALEFLDLRERAEHELGDAFDIREFHDVALEDGTVTLPMLREKIERWIREVQDR